jgi:hypothetical protein
MSYTQPAAEEIASRRAQLAPFDGWNERAFCQIVAWMGVPERYLDLGSGTGAMVNMARKIGVEAYGVDVINGPEHWFVTHDLTEPLVMSKDHSGQYHSLNAAPDPRLDDHFDLITCLEVAEHLPMDSHDTLCDTIRRHVGYGARVLFSAAPPGQRGEHHVGCRPAHEWRSMLYERGISYREDYTRQLCHLIGWVSGPASHWFAANLMVFDTWDGKIAQEVGR